ncbi:zinc ribbon domain-containing protein [candidate division KSB1 bacterium]|nr:zinc ribbon domain-containing protein [candidate division KSB1 bacterium]
MPIYEYKCVECQKEFEIFHTSSGLDSVECPKCRSKETKKLFSTFASTSYESASVAGNGSQGCCGGSCGCN